MSLFRVCSMVKFPEAVRRSRIAISPSTFPEKRSAKPIWISMFITTPPSIGMLMEAAIEEKSRDTSLPSSNFMIDSVERWQPNAPPVKTTNATTRTVFNTPTVMTCSPSPAVRCGRYLRCRTHARALRYCHGAQRRHKYLRII